MAKPSEKLAESLQALHELQANGTVTIRSANLSRTHRERLLRNGFLQEVIKGWYFPTRPDETAGEGIDKLSYIPLHIFDNLPCYSAAAYFHDTKARIRSIR